MLCNKTKVKKKKTICCAPFSFKQYNESSNVFNCPSELIGNCSDVNLCEGDSLCIDSDSDGYDCLCPLGNDGPSCGDSYSKETYFIFTLIGSILFSNEFLILFIILGTLKT